jgi:hypothetical protein
MGDDNGADRGSGTDVPRSFTMTAQRLHAQHPSVSTETISGMLLLAFHHTEAAPVQNFRALLAERDVRARLSDAAVAVRLHQTA